MLLAQLKHPTNTAHYNKCKLKSSLLILLLLCSCNGPYCSMSSPCVICNHHQKNVETSLYCETCPTFIISRFEFISRKTKHLPIFFKSITTYLFLLIYCTTCLLFVYFSDYAFRPSKV